MILSFLLPEMTRTTFSNSWEKGYGIAIGRLLVFLFLFNGFFSYAQSNFENQKKEHRILSANIRVALKEDDEKGTGWSDRRALVFEVLRKNQADIMCFQEVLEVQNEDLKFAFPEYFSFGFEGPEMDAHKDNEYHGIAKNPIMFLKKRYELISAGTYWLSESPHLGGTKSWNTARARHVNWIRLKDRSTGNEFRVLNAHLDHISDEARKAQVALILEEAEQYPKEFIQVLAGDFNADQSTAPIANLKKQWKDTYAEVHGDEDPGFTAHAFQGKAYSAKKKLKGKIDFIFFKPDLKVISAEIIKDDFNGIYPSDHYFITTDLFF